MISFRRVLAFFVHLQRAQRTDSMDGKYVHHVCLEIVFIR